MTADPAPLMLNAVPVLCADCEQTVYEHELPAHACEDRQ